MDVNQIVATIDAEISRLEQVRKALSGIGTRQASGAPSEKKRRGRPKGSANKTATAEASSPVAKRRTMSAEGKARIAAAQRARWAKRNEPVKKAPKAKREISAKKAAPLTKSASKKAASSKTSAKPNAARTAAAKSTSATPGAAGEV